MNITAIRRLSAVWHRIPEGVRAFSQAVRQTGDEFVKTVPDTVQAGEEAAVASKGLWQRTRDFFNRSPGAIWNDIWSRIRGVFSNKQTVQQGAENLANGGSKVVTPATNVAEAAQPLTKIQVNSKTGGVAEALVHHSDNLHELKVGDTVIARAKVNPVGSGSDGYLEITDLSGIVDENYSAGAPLKEYLRSLSKQQGFEGRVVFDLGNDPLKVTELYKMGFRVQPASADTSAVKAADNANSQILNLVRDLKKGKNVDPQVRIDNIIQNLPTTRMYLPD